MRDALWREGSGGYRWGPAMEGCGAWEQQVEKADASVWDN